jgi:hypothetical protein
MTSMIDTLDETFIQELLSKIDDMLDATCEDIKYIVENYGMLEFDLEFESNSFYEFTAYLCQRLINIFNNIDYNDQDEIELIDKIKKTNIFKLLYIIKNSQKDFEDIYYEGSCFYNSISETRFYYIDKKLFKDYWNIKLSKINEEKFKFTDIICILREYLDKIEDLELPEVEDLHTVYYITHFIIDDGVLDNLIDSIVLIQNTKKNTKKYIVDMKYVDVELNSI